MSVRYIRPDKTQEKIETTQDIEYLRRWAMVGFHLHQFVEALEDALPFDEGTGVENLLWDAGVTVDATDHVMKQVWKGRDLMETTDEPS